jgi:hypothetical protein
MVTEEVGSGRIAPRAGRHDSSWSLGSWRVAAAICSAALLGCGMSSREPGHGEATASGGSAGVRGDFGGGAGVGGHAAGNGGTGNGGTGNGGTGNGGAPSSSEFFIEGLFDGERIVAESDVRGRWFQGLNPGWLELRAQGEGITWFIYVREGTVDQSCGTATITLLREDAGQAVYFLSGWSGDADPCTLVVAEPPGPVGEVIEGTFTATLSPLGQPGSVAEGSFRVPRLEDEPPAD